MLEPHLAGKKTTKKNQNSNTLNLQPVKASLCHVTLRKQESSKPAWEMPTNI
jgi:hypothetical protein